jgi:phosphatidylglycerol:prolipoprotein diacylglycerol transferase
MYLAGFAAGWWLGRRRTRQAWRGLGPADLDDLLFFVVLGIVLGGRLGYLLFYGHERLLADPSYAFKVWQGGMSFHGGLIGVIVAMAWFARSRRLAFLQVADFVAPLVPPGLLAGRVGNFINGNLWGAPTDLPWGVVFPSPAAGDVARHPTQLYEAALEGLVLFAALWVYSRRPRPLGSICGLFLLGYGVMRFGVEFVRVPDAQLGYLAFGWLTMGQVLTVPMIVVGVALLAWGRRSGTMPVPRPRDEPASRARRGGSTRRRRR